MSQQTSPTKPALLIRAYGYIRCHAWQPFEMGAPSTAMHPFLLNDSVQRASALPPQTHFPLPMAPTTPEWYSSSVVGKSAVRISNGFKAFEKFNS
jgi:hypothetical protein